MMIWRMKDWVLRNWGRKLRGWKLKGRWNFVRGVRLREEKKWWRLGREDRGSLIEVNRMFSFFFGIVFVSAGNSNVKGSD